MIVKTFFKCLMLSLLILITTQMVYAEDQVIDVYYHLNNTPEFHLIDFSSFLLRVHTTSNSICRYSLTSGVSYSDMSLRFDYDYGLTHEKTFGGFSDGLYKFYVKCQEDINPSEPSELELDLRVDSLVSADIVLSPQSPLRAGKNQVTLITSKPVFRAPILSYSYDNVLNYKITLFGNEKNWLGYLIIPPDLGNSIGSFKFSAADLEGRYGEQITTGGVFIVDTTKPKPVSYVNAIGDSGQIKLMWYSEENLNKVNIYRSNSPNPDYTNFYKTSDKSPFLDNFVERGKTYYYRVSGLDEAGNEGELSSEAYATALLDNSSLQPSGLALNLRGSVDSFVSDIDSLALDIDTVASAVSSKSEKEKNLFLKLNLGKTGSNAKSELNSLKNDVLKYKLQDLTKEELQSKLDSVRLKLDLIKKKVPEDIVITLENSRTETFIQEDIETTLLQLNSTISDNEKQRNVKDSLKIIEDSKLSIKSNFYVLEIVYLDGTKKEVSIVERDISSELDKSENTYFYEIIPKELSESASQITVMNSDYLVVKDDPILAFSTDNKKIFYSFNKEATLSSLKDTKIVLVSLSKDENPSAGITGYSILPDLSNTQYSGALIILVLLAGLIFYFIYSKKKTFSPDFLDLDRDVDEAFHLLKKGKIRDAEEIYSSLDKTYKRLSDWEKTRAYPIVDLLRNKMLIFNIEEGIKKLELKKDPVVFESIKKIYGDLPDKFKKELSKPFENIQIDFENVK